MGRLELILELLGTQGKLTAFLPARTRDSNLSRGAADYRGAGLEFKRKPKNEV